MIDEQSVRAIAAAQWGTHFIRPLYDSYCFAQIPRVIEAALLGGDPGGLPLPGLDPLTGQYEQVVLFFIDAFGWRFFERHADDYPFLRRMVQEGVVSKLTSQFPSTTAAHMTAIHTGLTPGASGVYEWFYYEPQVDAIIAPLLYSFAGDDERGTLFKSGLPPTAFFPQRSLYPGWKARGVTTTLFIHEDYALSPYGAVVCAGAQPAPYKTLPEALTNLSAALLANRGRSYYFFYTDTIDSICHHYGPQSPQVAAEIDAVFTLLERLFYQQLAGKLKNTLLLVTADHGQVETVPEATIYLNQTLPALRPYLRTNRQGQPLVPAGSCRDMFLYIAEGRVDAAAALLRDHLAGRAEVHMTKDLLAQNFFGPGDPSPEFLGRVGHLVILPYAGESVWWYEKGRFEQPYRGHHGGLTRAEMETILLALPV
jgi:hypothetical protein